MINLTLNKLKRPALLNLVPKFGTLVEKNDINKGGLSTAEVDVNMTLPFELMREIEVSSSDTTTKIHYDARVAIVGSDPVTLTLDGATYKGCTVTITNRNTEQATIVLSEDNEKRLESKQSLVLKWDGTAWNDTTLVVDSTVSEESHNPVTSAAVYQKATEITEAYTQAIADETNSRGEAIAEEQRLREEAITATEQKITETDTRLTQQITAIEQLHNALVSNAEGFVDSDGDTVTVEDSGKTIRQIAHEEFYRQLITDAADVQTQIDTLKELADYLQTNPSVITDMYSKLGITWSVDNLTDFGTFDFSSVLSATNVDDAVLELYNTFTGKIGELTSLATSAKDNIVTSVNELNTKIGEEVTARTEADTALGTRIDEETAARTQADTELDGKITQLGNSVGQLDSLATEEKTSTVAAINELHNLIETSSETLTVVCEIEDSAERVAGPSGIVYTQGKIDDIDTLSQQVADNKPVQLILKSKNYMPYGFIALTSYILRPSGILNFSGYIDETQIEDEETSPVRSANKTCIHVNVDTRTGIVSIEDVDIKDIFINVAFEGDIGTEDVTITKTLSTYDIRLINNLKTGKNASTSAKFSFGGIEVVTNNYDVSDDKIVFTGEANIGDRLVSYKVIISSESADNCRLEIGKSATEKLSGVAGEVNTLKESVSELGTEVEALKTSSGRGPITDVTDNTDPYALKEYIDDPYIQEDDDWYDLVIDSNEKLAQWVDSTSADDKGLSFNYNRIKVKKGTWTYTANLDNLSSLESYTRDVKAITYGECLHAEPGAKLVLKGLIYGIIFKSMMQSDILNGDHKASYLRNLVVEFQPFLVFYYGLMLTGIHNCNIIINEKFHRENIHRVSNTEHSIPIPLVNYTMYISSINNSSNIFKLPANSYITGTDANIFNTNVYIQNVLCNESLFNRVTADGLNIYKKCPAPASTISDKNVPTVINSSESVFYNSNVNIIVTDDYSKESWPQTINDIIISDDIQNKSSASAFIIAFADSKSSQFYNCNADIRLKCSTPILSNSNERIFRYSIQPMAVGFVINEQYCISNCNVNIDMGDSIIPVKALSGDSTGQILTCGFYGSSTSVKGSIRNCSSIIAAPMCTGDDLDRITNNHVGFGVLKNLEGCTARVFGINNNHFPDFQDVINNTVFGYMNCQNVTNCIALLSACTELSHGFAQCKGMFKCISNSGFKRYISASQTENRPVTPFMTTNCCANIESYTAETSVAPTLEGGYNVDIGII